MTLREFAQQYDKDKNQADAQAAHAARQADAQAAHAARLLDEEMEGVQAAEVPEIRRRRINERLVCGDITYRKLNYQKVLHVTPHVPASAENAAFAWHVLVLDTAWRSIENLVHEGETIVDALRRKMTAGEVAQRAHDVLTTDAEASAFDHIPYAAAAEPANRHEYGDEDEDEADAQAAHAERLFEEEEDPESLAVDDDATYAERLLEEEDEAAGKSLGRFTAGAAFGTQGAAARLRQVTHQRRKEREDFVTELSRVVEETRLERLVEREVAGAERLDDAADDLEGRQRDAYEHITAALNDDNAPQLRVAVIGEAGTGKSKLIHAITRFARRKHGPNAACVMAYMGCAAYNVYGKTIHSTMGLKGGPGAKIPNDPTLKTPEKIDKLKKRFQEVKIIIVDEISLVDVKMLHAIDVLLNQVGVNRDAEPSRFGGYHVVFMGDFYQLPPIANTPLFDEHRKLFETYEEHPDQEGLGDRARREGRLAWCSVNVVFELDVNYRQRGDTTGFIDTLRKARQGGAPDTSQIDALKARQCSIAEAFERADDDALWVTHENKTRAALNEADLRRCEEHGSQIAHVWAQHARPTTRDGFTVGGRPAALSEKELRELVNHNTGDVDPATHPSLLRLAIGARVAVTTNLDYNVGTYNGASGTLVALEYLQGTRSEDLRLTYDQVLTGRVLPEIPVALVQFDSVDHKDKNDPDAHSCDMEIGGNVVPVFPEVTTIKIDRKTFKRTQLPLVLARATTIHKSQGRTVKNLVYAPMEPFGAGQAYVATSRVTSLAGLHIIEPDERLKIVDVNKTLFTAHNQKLKAVDVEMRRLRQIAGNNATRTPPRAARAETPPATDARSRTRPRDASDSLDPETPSPRRRRRAA